MKKVTPSNNKGKTLIEDDNLYSSREQLDIKSALARSFEHAQGSTEDKLASFMKFVSRQEFSFLLARYEIFKKILDNNVKGSIVECGVYHGNGLMTWAHLSAALEPINYNRQVIGFDTFTGNASYSKEKDKPSTTSLVTNFKDGGYKSDSYDELLKIIKLYDANRFLSHIPKIQLVKGNITNTIPKYLKDNPHLMVSLLALSVNLYEPTLVALRKFLPRMPKGAIIAINTLNEPVYPGATTSLIDALGLDKHRVCGCEFYPNLSYIVLE